MKQAIKILQKRFNDLTQEHNELYIELDLCEMSHEAEFVSNLMANIKLEQTELTKAIKILNKHVK
jgi:prefoldin subunit 5